MHSLFLRIFMLFWLAMALIVGASMATTFTIASREYESPEMQRRPAGGHPGLRGARHAAGISALKSWLDSNKNSYSGPRVFIIGPDGHGHPRPAAAGIAARRLEYFNRDEIVNREAPGGQFAQRPRSAREFPP